MFIYHYKIIILNLKLTTKTLKNEKFKHIFLTTMICVYKPIQKCDRVKEYNTFCDVNFSYRRLFDLK